MKQQESNEQKAVFQWAAYRSSVYPELRTLYASANGGRRDRRTGARLKEEGVKAGVSDIHMPVARGGYIGLWIELKAKGGTVQQSQKDWISLMRSHGHCAYVCYGYDSAVELIERYINGITIDSINIAKDGLIYTHRGDN